MPTTPVYGFSRCYESHCLLCGRHNQIASPYCTHCAVKHRERVRFDAETRCSLGNGNSGVYACNTPDGLPACRVCDEELKEEEHG